MRIQKKENGWDNADGELGLHSKEVPQVRAETHGVLLPHLTEDEKEVKYYSKKLEGTFLQPLTQP